MQIDPMQMALLVYALMAACTALHSWRVLEDSAADCDSCEYHRTCHQSLDRVNQMMREEMTSPALVWALICVTLGVSWPKTIWNHLRYIPKRREQRSGCTR